MSKFNMAMVQDWCWSIKNYLLPPSLTSKVEHKVSLAIPSWVSIDVPTPPSTKKLHFQ
jgi:hypothetical protein